LATENISHSPEYFKVQKDLILVAQAHKDLVALYYSRSFSTSTKKQISTRFCTRFSHKFSKAFTRFFKLF